jgi:hypothetical protein
VLARELSAGDDEAARLFRQAITLTREVEQARVTLARLNALPEPGTAEREQITKLARELEVLQASQAATQAKLADFPRFRALSTKALTLDDLRASLRPGEAYLKMSQVGGSVYAMLVTADIATAYRTSATPAALEETVTALRNSISVGRGWPAADLSVRRRACAQAVRRSVRPVSSQLASARHIVLRAGRRDAELPLNFARHRRRQRRPLSQSGKATSSTSATSPGSAGSATFRPPFRPAPFATCARCRSPRPSSIISGSARMRRCRRS